MPTRYRRSIARVSILKDDDTGYVTYRMEVLVESLDIDRVDKPDTSVRRECVTCSAGIFIRVCDPAESTIPLCCLSETHFIRRIGISHTHLLGGLAHTSVPRLGGDVQIRIER
ncbi:hypothetical protein SAMN06266787_11728 [Halorubrum ezzemoulense]|uniref:Uncharacterized protein n=1 Tax=Halorubrum ezzemoulense TaxID=337243 RepID=A0A238YQN5_HALEZ|nr:hypothetical protein SAMN06266787_11728 [Halorubrum ezzemoulense]